MTKTRVRCLIACLTVLLTGRLSLADGLIIIHNPPPRPTPGHFTFAPLEVTYHRVTVDIKDQVAVTKIDQEFYNPNPQQLEGTYVFPLPVGAHIDRFQMDVNGQMMEAELLPADKARSLYESIVRQSRDPALLEYVGRDAFRVRIFPIEGQKRKQIKLEYTQLLKSDSGLTEYTYPLNTEKFSSKPLNDVSVKVTVATKEPLRAVYSPSHHVEVRRSGERAATIGFEERNTRPDTDFKLIYSSDKSPVGVDLMTYRNSPDNGYFLLMASPGMTASAAMIQKKDIALVLDTSSSMAGPKLNQAKKALQFCLANLNEGDRFEVIRFSTEAEPLFDGLVDATRENVDKAHKYVEGLKPIGGTAISDAMAKALDLGKARRDADARPYLVIFLTDGQPTIGETNEDKIIAASTRNGTSGTRIFCFGIGTDVNTRLLDRVANDTRAVSQYVLPDEDLEVKLSSFYTKIKEPVLANLKVEFTGAAKASQFYPSSMPDLFKGEVLTVFGRYTGHGPGAVKITGTLNGEKQEFVADVSFAEHDTTSAFIPRLWATRRVGWLLDEIRLRGESNELKEEVTRLAREHGIVTPYTAYLILEDERRRGVPVALQNMRELREDREVAMKSEGAYSDARRQANEPAARSGGGAVANAKDLAELRYRDNLGGMKQDEIMAKAGPGGSAATAARPADHGYRTQVAQNYATQSRVLNGRAFYQNGKVWTDSTAQAQQNLKQRKVAFNSEEYFDLIRKNRDITQWLSLGNDLDLVIGDTLYLIRDES